ncbi:MAG TPA: right-handed parallel beta-helix repeat-containing protein [Blastocatellia bacterium]|nr:right-handed parallel beta-helix repeat-containing protein [Blastocatellia bacterium]
MNIRNALSNLAGLIVLNGTPSRAIWLALGSFLFVAVFASASEAQQRTFVSGLGNDSNPCGRTAPCRTFTQAISVTNAGGEVVVLDSAGYGAFAITKGVTVQAPPGVYAGISVFSGNGISINAGGTDTVILRGLTVNDQGSSGAGIDFSTGGMLYVESCVVSGFTTSTGISCHGGGKLEVKDSIVRGNGTGISVFGLSAVAVDHVRLEANQNSGLVAQDGAKVSIRNSVASSNEFGLSALSSSASAAELNIESCVVSNNASTGIAARSDSTGVATVRISGSTVTDNTFGLANFGAPAVLLSRVNNTVEGNVVNTSGVIGPYAGK